MAESVVPRGVEHAAVLHGLVRKRADYAARVERCQLELKDLLVAVEHVDATIRLFCPEVQVEGIRPRRTPAAHAAAPGEVSQAVFNALRASDIPLTSRELAAEVVKRRGLEEGNRALEITMAARVRACLRHHRKRGVLKAIALDDGIQAWLLVGSKADRLLAEVERSD